MENREAPETSESKFKSDLQLKRHAGLNPIPIQVAIAKLQGAKCWKWSLPSSPDSAEYRCDAFVCAHIVREILHVPQIEHLGDQG